MDPPIQSYSAKFTPSRDNTARHTQTIVARVEGSEVFRDYQHAFESVTGLPLTIRAAGSFRPPLHGSKRANPFCTLMATKNKSCAACLKFQQHIEERASAEPQTLECFAGLCESAVPLRNGETVLGYLQTGQVLLETPSKRRFGRMVRVAQCGAEIGTRELEAVYFRTRVIAKKQYESVLRLLAIFAQQLATLSNQIMLKEAAAELPAVAQARRFIADHLEDELSLATVAQVVHMSPFYFCKVFRQETGLTFTDYVSRARIERVKQFLVNPHTRISEAAFAAGYQSLSQFNRDFHRLLGESPSDFRARLPAARGLRQSALNGRRSALLFSQSSG